MTMAMPLHLDVDLNRTLFEQAGKVLSLDKLASQFFTTTASRPDILKQAQEYVASLSATASDGVKRATKTETTTEYYLKAMQRILEKGEGWVEKETARWVDCRKKRAERGVD